MPKKYQAKRGSKVAQGDRLPGAAKWTPAMVHFHLQVTQFASSRCCHRNVAQKLHGNLIEREICAPFSVASRKGELRAEGTKSRGA